MLTKIVQGRQKADRADQPAKHRVAEIIEKQPAGKLTDQPSANYRNHVAGLRFEQAGPTTYYMGGDGATFVASPRALYGSTIELNPGFAAYVLQKLNPADYPLLRGVIDCSTPPE